MAQSMELIQFVEDYGRLPRKWEMSQREFEIEKEHRAPRLANALSNLCLRCRVDRKDPALLWEMKEHIPDDEDRKDIQYWTMRDGMDSFFASVRAACEKEATDAELIEEIEFHVGVMLTTLEFDHMRLANWIFGLLLRNGGAEHIDYKGLRVADRALMRGNEE